MRPYPNNPNGNDDDANGAADEHPREPSRSQRRREALDVLKLAQQLAGLSDAQLKSVPLSEDLLDETRRARAVTEQIARKRQVQFLAKQMRKLDTEELDAVRAALEHDRELARRETADLQHVERWRDRLIEHGDDALGELVAQFPQSDRQTLRQLARNARVERERNKPLHAYHELFRLLRALIGH